MDFLPGSSVSRDMFMSCSRAVCRVFPLLVVFLLLSLWSVAASAALVVTVSPSAKTVDEGAGPIVLAASASGANGVVMYSWALKSATPSAPTNRLSGTTGNSVTFSPPAAVVDDATYVYTVTGTDTGEVSDSADVTITVKNVPLAVAISGSGDFDEGTERTLSASVTGGTQGYTYQWTIASGSGAVEIVGSSTEATVKLKGKEVSSDTQIEVGVTVKDSTTPTKETATKTATMHVKNVTAAFNPSIGGASSVDEGKEVTLTANPGGGKSPYTYKWKIASGTAAEIVGGDTGATVKVKGKEVATNTDVQVELTITDDSSPKLTKTVTRTLTVKNVTAAFNPSIGGASSVDEGKEVTLTANPGGGKPPYTYKWKIASGTAAEIVGGDTGATVKVKGKEVATNTDVQVELTITDASSPKLTKTVTRTLTVKSVPKLPEAKLTIASTSVDEGQSIVLDGSGSNDPDGQITKYIWKLDGKLIEQGADKNKLTYTAPRVGKGGKELKFSLVVEDNDGNMSAPKEVTIAVNDTINSPPDAKIEAATTTIKPGAVFTLDGSGSSDPDGDDTIKSYQWSQKADDPLQVTIIKGGSAVGEFRAPPISETVQLTLILTVTDEEGKSDTAQIEVVVTLDENLKKPVANAGEDEIAEAGRIVKLSGLKSRDGNADGSITSYEWKQLSGPGVTLADADKAEATFTAPDVVGELEFELTVIDNDSLFATDTVSVFVGPQGGLQVDAGQDQIDVEEGSTVSLSGQVLNGSIGGEQKIRWRQIDDSGSRVVLSDALGANAYFVTPPITGGVDAMVLSFEFVSWDSQKGVGIDRVDVTVKDNGITSVPETYVPIRSETDASSPVGFDMESGRLVRLDARKVPLNERATQKNRPKRIPYGLFDFALKVDKPGDTVELKIWFPEDVSSGYDWFKYDVATETWSRYENARFEGHEVLLTLTDGGEGDADGKSNGIIYDPGALGTKIATDKVRIEGESGGGSLGWALLAAGLGLRRKQRRAA